MNKRIYISGKITGNDNYQTEFAAAEERIRAAGDIPINPAKLNEVMPQSNWNAYIDVCLTILEKGNIDAIYFLTNWRDSLGASLEQKRAKDLKIKITYE